MQIFKTTVPDETFVQVKVPGKNLDILIPDNRRAYGDKESVAQMAGEIVTKHTGNDSKAGEAAYEQARGQYESIDWSNERRRRAKERVMAKKPKMMLHYTHDNTGTITGVEVLMNMTNPKTGLSEAKIHRFSMDELAKLG